MTERRRMAASAPTAACSGCRAQRRHLQARAAGAADLQAGERHSVEGRLAGGHVAGGHHAQAAQLAGALPRRHLLEQQAGEHPRAHADGDLILLVAPRVGGRERDHRTTQQYQQARLIRAPPFRRDVFRLRTRRKVSAASAAAARPAALASSSAASASAALPPPPAAAAAARRCRAGTCCCQRRSAAADWLRGGALARGRKHQATGRPAVVQAGAWGRAEAREPIAMRSRDALDADGMQMGPIS